MTTYWSDTYKLWVLKQSLIKIKIKAIPIVIYHRTDDIYVPNYNTEVDLFEREMRYLYNNYFQVITRRDLGYQETGDYLYVISAKDQSLTGRMASVSDK